MNGPRVWLDRAAGARGSTRLVLVVLAVATGTACGPIRSSAALQAAETEIQAARAAGASGTATYDLVSAESYLGKAREASRRSEYELAMRLANRSVERAQKARSNALAQSGKPRKVP